MRARRGVLCDVFEHENESVVMAGTNVVRLSAFATSLVRGLADWRSSDELARMLIDQFGDPADVDAVQRVESALRQLAALDIVELEP